MVLILFLLSVVTLRVVSSAPGSGAEVPNPPVLQPPAAPPPVPTPPARPPENDVAAGLCALHRHLEEAVTPEVSQPNDVQSETRVSIIKD